MATEKEEVKDPKIDPAPDKKVEPDKEGYKLPETDYFRGGNMEKFIDEFKLDKDYKEPTPEPTPKKTPEKKPEVKAAVKDDEDCPDCPPGEKKTKQETTEPYAVLKVDGKEQVIQTKEEYEDYAQKGLHATQMRQTDAEWEKTLNQRETKLEELGGNLRKLVEMNQGQTTPAGDKPAEEALDDDDLDPTVRDRLKAVDGKLKALEEENVELKKDKDERTLEKTAQVLDVTLEEARKEHPFEEVVDKESGVNITQQQFAGLLSVKVNNDRIAGKKIRSMREYMNDTARDIKKLEEHFKGAGSGDGDVTIKLTTDGIIKDHPEIADEIMQRGVAVYLKQKEETTAPVAKSEKADTKVETKGEEKDGRRKTLREHIQDGVDEPSIADEIARVGEKNKAFV